ncbi:Allene oxide synthase [Morus notabilis]|uniref:Allene oxide synthase n=1 Tax=Morus notabilis TaxID=981085 RepID=W9RBR2_9ROSA|nr:allene oxide synthase 3 [Morus notabilis]EXB63649.1 Allene oxide synthase [Morus notabilis]
MSLPTPTYPIPLNPFHEEQPFFFNPPQDDDELPLKEIPGSYDPPFIGAIMDRWDFYYNQGRDGFFRARQEKYKSTVFRANAPPGPFIAKESKVVVLLDAISFPILFDTTKVEKTNFFDTTYMPSVNFFGGYRVLAFLDPSEPKHKALKQYFFNVLASKHDNFIPLLRKSLADLFNNLESQLEKSKEVNFNPISDSASFNYIFELFCDKSPSKTDLGPQGNKTFVDIWLVPQVTPIVTFGVPKLLQLVEDLLIHTFPIPAFLVKGKYKTIFEAFSSSAGPTLDKAKDFGIQRDEACHNLIFITCFNTYGGLKVLFPALFKWLGRASPTWHANLAKEIRNVVKQEGGVVTLAALEKMSLLKSVVYEVLRIDPPVPFQCARAKEDLVIQSHDASFKIKKGELIYGYQPFATKDPKVFENPETFVPYRFMGKAEANIKYVYWSNGRETEDPTVDDKQCAGKDLVVLMARVMLVEFFLRYDTFTCTDEVFLVGSKVTFTSLTKAGTVKTKN